MTDLDETNLNSDVTGKSAKRIRHAIQNLKRGNKRSHDLPKWKKQLNNYKKRQKVGLLT